jgi:HAD superfamily hydrolase (TIGR01484 family)
MASFSYSDEIELLKDTYADAMSRKIDQLKSAIAVASSSSVIGVGSGGSYTVASLLCGLHEAYTGRVSRPSTPLELICNPTLAFASPAFLISAEGKNPDILEGLRRARSQSSRPIHVITNRLESPLARAARELPDVKLHSFDLKVKDGYLATNSLLFDAVLIARAYGEFDLVSSALPSDFDSLPATDQGLDTWVVEATSFARTVSKRGSIIVLYSPQLRAIATDLESKLSEAALIHCQIADLRSFAHGRHLWAAERPEDCSILAITEPSLEALWHRTKDLLPLALPVHEMRLKGSSPADLIAGIVLEMHFVSQLAKSMQRDIGNPVVPAFGRDIHYLEVQNLIPQPQTSADEGEASKLGVLGANWSSRPRGGTMHRAMMSYKEHLQRQVYRAIVFDYDGTLCSSQGTDSPPSAPIIRAITLLLENGITVGIASGRGGSIQQYLFDALPDWASQIHLGLYNGGWLGTAAFPPQADPQHDEFISHATRIAHKLMEIGVPISKVRTTQPYQVSLRLAEGVIADDIWLVIADALRLEGLDVLRVVKSKHSVDILSPVVSKAKVTRHIIQECGIDPYEILTMGDHGAWPGNDSSLLEHRYSLSVDEPSRFLDRGWKLSPFNKRELDATLWYLQRFDLSTRGCFRLNFDS